MTIKVTDHTSSGKRSVGTPGNHASWPTRTYSRLNRAEAWIAYLLAMFPGAKVERVTVP